MNSHFSSWSICSHVVLFVVDDCFGCERMVCLVAISVMHCKKVSSDHMAVLFGQFVNRADKHTLEPGLLFEQHADPYSFIFSKIHTFRVLNQDHSLLDSLVVECWHRVWEVPGSIPSQGPPPR